MTWMIAEEETPAERAGRLLAAGLLDDAQQAAAVRFGLLTAGQVSATAQIKLANLATLDGQANGAIARLTQIITQSAVVIGDATITTAETATYLRQIAQAVQDLARHQRAIIRLLRYALGVAAAVDTVDP